MSATDPRSESSGLEPLTSPPAEENDDSVNDPDGLEEITEDDMEDAPDHGDDPNESDADTA